MNFASSDMRSGVQGGSNVSSTCTASTPGSAATASWIPSWIIGPAGHPIDVSEWITRTLGPSISASENRPSSTMSKPSSGASSACSASITSFSVTTMRRVYLDPCESLRARQHEAEHLADRLVEGRVLDHQHIEALSPVEEDVLDHPDLRHAVEVLLERPQAVRRRIPHPEVAAMRVLVGDRDHALDDERVGPVDLDHPRDDVNALEHHRPALRQGAVD